MPNKVMTRSHTTKINAQAHPARELNLVKPFSPQEFGRWVFHKQKPLHRLAALEDLKPWQLAFSAGLESFVRQSQNQSADVPIRSDPSPPQDRALKRSAIYFRSFQALAAAKLPQGRQNSRGLGLSRPGSP